MKPNANNRLRMGTLLARNWWTVALRGVIAILFGIVVLVWPSITLRALVILFALLALASGFLSLGTVVSQRRIDEPWWLLLLEGIFGIAVGIIILNWQEITGLVLVYWIAGWAILSGLLELVVAIQLRRQIKNEVLLVAAGIASLLFGLLLVIWPVTSALAILWLMGAYALIFGVLLLILAWRLRTWKRGESPILF